MNFNMRFKMNSINKIIKDHELNKDGAVTKFLRDDVDRLSDAYIPMDTGTLKNNKTYPNNHSIKYVQQYAHYMYKGKVAVGASKPKGVKRSISNKSIKYQGAPKRGAEWEKRMLNDKKGELIRDINNYIKRGGK